MNRDYTRGSVEAWLLVAPAEDDKEDGFCSYPCDPPGGVASGQQAEARRLDEVIRKNL